MMIAGSDILWALKQLIRDRAGNFGILTAIAVPVLAVAGGVAVDVTNMSLTRSQLQESTDAAALTAATALADGSATTTTAKDLANNFVLGQMSNYLAGDTDATNSLKAGTGTTVTKTTDSSGNSGYTVVVNASYSMPVNSMTRLTGQTSLNISASSTSTSGKTTETQKNALSMYFVLDRSGSMDEATDTVNAEQPTKKNCWGTYCTTQTNYYSKMESLKIATSNLSAQLNKADPNMMYVRTGAVSYNNVAQTATALAWGTSGITTYVNNLTSKGSTNSAPAFTAAVDALTKPSATAGLTNEQLQHKNKSGVKNPTMYVVFMTDGENNVSNADADTKAQCDKARSNGIHVYTIAFMAPENGQALLKYCATSASDYFTPQSAADLFKAFTTIATETSKQMTLLTK
ncbi:pilus assembly protein TadG-related protein [Rhizobium miluonense]|uniref:Flp pilus assembly protein TadG n=1 Tax=Rhizobium miluonense TaxID=411945 RepID=A0ABU1SP87_9HYPH|nr:pilus assembly protein TadG-related protein [Rhizobium miluonense]MDR6900789.1 Flp pilus assembly protein TadG [Rhizobium miluonense]